MQSKAKQGKAKQSKAKQSKTKQRSKAKQSNKLTKLNKQKQTSKQSVLIQAKKKEKKQQNEQEGKQNPDALPTVHHQKRTENKSNENIAQDAKHHTCKTRQKQVNKRIIDINLGKKKLKKRTERTGRKEKH